MKQRKPARAAAAPRISNLDSLLVGIAALVVYLLFAPPVSGDKDASEFTLVLATNGIAHPTGYPLFTLLGHFFVTVVHALGATWSYAANAWSAAGGAVAIGLIHALTARLARGPRWLPFVPLLLVGLNPMWAVEATLAEVYSWHVAWACGLACLFVTYVRRSGELPLSQPALWGVLCGVGLAHHLTSITVSVPLSAALCFVLARAKRLRAGSVALPLSALPVPHAASGWIAVRPSQPGRVMWPPLAGTPASVIKHVTGRTYVGYLGWFSPSPQQRDYLAHDIYPFLFPALVLALGAAWRTRGPERVIRWGLWAATVVGTVYAFSYGVSDPSSYFLAPLFLALASASTLLSGRVASVVAAVLAALSLWLSTDWVRTDLERRRQFIGFNGMVHDMWQTIPGDSGFVFWRNDMYVRLREYQVFEGEKPGLAIFHPANLTHPAGRRRFVDNYGFDPLEGVDLRVPPIGAQGRQAAVDHLLDAIEARINRVSPLPVIHFDPAIPSVRLMKKQVVPPDSSRVSP